jgi:CheY-like chemotaxis protein
MIAPARKARRTGLERLHVLVVEDNRHMRDLMRVILDGLGVGSVRAVGNADAGFAELAARTPDIVFVDWMMEPVDGIEFVRQVRADEGSASRYVPIIMITGHTEAARVAAARDIGVTEFLAKPISARMVAQRLESVIHHPRPFVRTKMFFGPDRRRPAVEHAGGERRNSRRRASWPPATGPAG